MLADSLKNGDLKKLIYLASKVRLDISNQNQMKNEITLAIGIMTAPVLELRYNACIKTWVQDFNHIYLFGGYDSKSKLISLGNIGEDYKSAFLKQQLGLKYMYFNNPNADWYSIVGCDTILFKERLVSELSKFDSSKDLFLGTYYKPYSIDGIEFVSIHGGPGFYLSNSLMKKIIPLMDDFNIYWYNKSQSKQLNNVDYSSSDSALSFMVKKYFNIDFTPMRLLFGDVAALTVWESKQIEPVLNEDKPIALHYIKADRMADFYQKYQ